MGQRLQKSQTRGTTPALFLAPFRFLHTWGLLCGAGLISAGVILLLELAAHDLTLELLVGGGIAVVSLILIWTTAQRVAVWRYLKAMKKEQRRKRRGLIYTPLAA